MIEHYLQKRILSDLIECESARYSDLKPSHIAGNVFAYHLQSLIKQNLIEKCGDGTYCLTNDGKLYGINNSLKAAERLRQAHSIILVMARQGDQWLLRRRLVQPLYGKIGFVHGESRAGENLQTAGTRILRSRTGLTAETIQVRGSGFITLNVELATVAYSNFTLLEATNISGELIAADKHGENGWHKAPDFDSADTIPSMSDLAAASNKPGLFFIDKVYELTT